MEPRTREEFADLCNERGISSAVEVGTDHGVFAEAFVDRWTMRGTLWCVDPYEPCEDYPYDREADFIMACHRLARFGDTCRIVREASVDAAVRYGREWVPGFVYFDGDHSHDAMYADLWAWWPCVRSGGVLAGHDFHPSGDGVLWAVTEFATANNLKIRVTDDEIPSWWVEKR